MSLIDQVVAFPCVCILLKQPGVLCQVGVSGFLFHSLNHCLYLLVVNITKPENGYKDCHKQDVHEADTSVVAGDVAVDDTNVKCNGVGKDEETTNHHCNCDDF